MKELKIIAPKGYEIDIKDGIVSFHKVRKLQVEYVDLGLPSGTMWAKCNVGAENEEDYGGHLEWDDAIKRYHLPTKEQFQELYDNCEWTWDEDRKGYLVTGKNGNSIFFPAAGYVSGTGLHSAGSYGYYWSSTLYSATNAYVLDFSSGYVYPQNYDDRSYGFTVRPVSE